MSISRGQYEADIRKTKADALREAARMLRGMRAHSAIRENDAIRLEIEAEKLDPS